MTRFFTRLTRELRHPDFTCENDELDRWFRQVAMQAQQLNTARTFVLVDDELQDGLLPMAFYSLAAHYVLAVDLPEDDRRRMPAGVPATLLARLGVLEGRHGERIGSAVMRHAVESAIAANENVASRLIVVDAIDNYAVGWYGQFGFRPLVAASRSARLVARVDELEEVFDRQ